MLDKHSPSLSYIPAPFSNDTFSCYLSDYSFTLKQDFTSLYVNSNPPASATQGVLKALLALIFLG